MLQMQTFMYLRCNLISGSCELESWPNFYISDVIILSYWIEKSHCDALPACINYFFELRVTEAGQGRSFGVHTVATRTQSLWPWHSPWLTRLSRIPMPDLATEMLNLCAFSFISTEIFIVCWSNWNEECHLIYVTGRVIVLCWSESLCLRFTDPRLFGCLM